MLVQLGESCFHREAEWIEVEAPSWRIEGALTPRPIQRSGQTPGCCARLASDLQEAAL